MSMAQFHDAYTAHQLKRWMRPDAHRFVRPDWRRFVRPGFERDFPFALCERKYSPDQPRDYHGRWTSEGGNNEDESKPIPQGAADTQEILAQSRQLAASGQPTYEKCLDICVPLLERFQPAGSDRNTWDFHKCMNACLGR